jgi:hypothetical protein
MNSNETKEPIELLCEAAASNDCDAINMLLEKNPALVNERHPRITIYPVDLAVEKGNVEALKLLVKKKANLKTPLLSHFAIHQSNASIIEYLTKKKVFQAEGITPLHIKAIRGELQDNEELHLLIASGALDKEDASKKTLLIGAVINNKLATAELLIQKGASPEKLKNWKNPCPSPLLLFFNSVQDFFLLEVIRGNVELCRFFVKYHLIENEKLANAFMIAVAENHFQIADMLLPNSVCREASQTFREKESQSNLLHLAILNDELEKFNYLIERDLVDINDKDNNGETVLQLAYSLGKQNFINAWVDCSVKKQIFHPAFKLDQEAIQSDKKFVRTLVLTTQGDEPNQEDLIKLAEMHRQVTENNKKIFSHLNNIIVNRLNEVKKNFHDFHQKILDMQLDLKILYQGSANKKYPEYEIIFNISFYNGEKLFSQIEKYLRLKLIENNVDKINSGFTEILLNINQFDEKFNEYKKSLQEKINKCEKWINTQKIPASKSKSSSKKKPGHKKHQHVIMDATMQYCFQVSETHKYNQPSDSKNKIVQQVRRLSLAYMILMTIISLRKFKLKEYEVSVLQNKLVRCVFAIDLQQSYPAKLFIKKELMPIFCQYPAEKNISLNKIQTFMQHFAKLNLKDSVNLDEDAISKIENIIQALHQLKFIMAKEIIFNEESYPHHIAAMKMIILNIGIHYESLFKMKNKIPEDIQNNFKIDGIDIATIKNKILNQTTVNDKDVLSFVKGFTEKTDGLIDNLMRWEALLENHVSQFELAPQFFASNAQNTQNASSVACSSTSSTSSVSQQTAKN